MKRPKSMFLRPFYSLWFDNVYYNPGGGGVLPYMGYIGMCRGEGYGFQAVELALVKVKGSRLPAAHRHPEIPKVPPPRDYNILVSHFLSDIGRSL